MTENQMPDTEEALRADISTLYQMNTDLANEVERLRGLLERAAGLLVGRVLKDEDKLAIGEALREFMK